jgi:hypothetical protein
MTEPWHDVEWVAAYLGVSTKSVRRRAVDLGAKRLGNRLLFRALNFFTMLTPPRSRDGAPMEVLQWLCLATRATLLSPDLVLRSCHHLKGAPDLSQDVSEAWPTISAAPQKPERPRLGLRHGISAHAPGGT